MVTIPDMSQNAGVPVQYSEDLAALGEALITGETPRVVTKDHIFAQNQTIPALSVVGLNDANEIVLATKDAVKGVRASGTITFSGTTTADDTITIGARVYTMKATPSSANQVKIGATAAESAANLIAAINGAAGAGTLYGTGTVPHADVTARANTSVIVGIVANNAGTGGNAIALEETGTNTAVSAATLANGAAGIGVAPIGISVVAVTTVGATKGAPIYREGCFNPNALNWPAGFVTEEQKLHAFEGAPSPTNIVLRRPKTATVTLP